MSDYLTIEKAAELMGCTKRHIRRMCIDGELPGAIKNGSYWQIPVTADLRLARSEPGGKLSRELRGVPEKKRKEAISRLGIVVDFERFAATIEKRCKAAELFAARHGIGLRTLQRWVGKYREQGLAGLVDTRGGGKFISQVISPEAFEMFKSMYLTQQRRSVKTCWQNISYINTSEKRNWQIPQLRFMYKYVQTQIPLFSQILLREGMAAYEAKCASYVQVDPDSVAPGQIWVGDHSQFNCWIRHRGRWFRPWITAWLDMRSRNIVGRDISVSPNQTTILRASKRGIAKYGPPDSVKIDNGRDYDSEMWTGTTKAKRRALKAGYLDEQMVAGIYAMMDIGVSFAIAYHPQAKNIERWFDTMDKQFTKSFATYCGKDTNRKPDYLNDLLKSEKALNEAYDLDSFTELVDKYIDAYNNTAHSGSGMNGKSPAEVFAARCSRRVLQDGVLDLVARGWSKELKIGKNGVRFKGMFYGQYDLEVLSRFDRRVRVAYDPDDLRKVYVYDAVTLKLITMAEQNRLIQYGDSVDEESLREAMRQKSKALRIAKAFRDSRLTANMDLTSLTIAAMQEGRKKPETKEQPMQTLRPVRTPLDGQVAEHSRQETVKAVRKAAGGESVSTVLDVDFDSMIPKNKGVKLKLFDD